MITITINNIERIRLFFSEIATRAREAFQEAGRNITAEAERLAKERVRDPSRRPGPGSGRYLDSITSHTESTPFQVVGKLSSDFEHAGVLEFGSAPHDITPRDKKVLIFPSARHPVKKVKHPGTPAFHVLGDAAQEAADRAQEFVDEAFRKKFE